MRTINVTKSDNTIEECQIYAYNEYDYNILKSYGKIKARQGHYIINIPCAFDIETTTIVRGDKKEGFMYIWQFCIFDKVIMGRTWDEFIKLIDTLKEYIGKNHIVVYVHNLAFEFQFMRRFFEWDNIFAKDVRKVLKARTGNVEFRCSYYLTNMSLEKACKNARNCLFYKKSGEKYDYTKIRTAETYMEDFELEYCYCDVRGLCEVIADKLEEDTLDTIPLTSTGYVRRDCRNAMRKNKENRKLFKKCAVNKEVYKLLEEAKRGGNTHANRLYAGDIMHNVKCFDVASSYPFQMMCRYFPSSAFMLLSRNIEKTSFYKAIDKYCCLFRVAFTELEVLENVPVPYIAYHKCLKHHKDDIVFNGRLLSSPATIMTVTEIDFKIIVQQYKYKTIAVSDFYIAERGGLPRELKDQIIHYFENKTKLKGVDDYMYAKSKNLLNSIFGMMCTNPVHDIITLDDTWSKDSADVEQALSKYYNSRNSFLSIQNGIWVTAHARAWLQKAIDITGMNTLYCDTDSNKCINTSDDAFEELNKEAIALCEKYGAYADNNGKRYYMGIFEQEETYSRFRTWGSKKYVYEVPRHIDIDDYTINYTHTAITIAGVHKTKGAKYLNKIGGLDAFKTGIVFKGEENGGGTESHWNDDAIHEITVNGCTMQTGANVGILPSSYTLGVTNEFLENMGFNIDEMRIM